MLGRPPPSRPTPRSRGRTCMNGLIQFSLGNWYAVVVLVLSIAVLGALTLTMIPIDILPVFKSPAVQVLTFYGGMPADQRREGHHQPHGALDRPGRRHRPAGVALHRRRQHRPQLLPRGHRSQRRPDAGQLAGLGRHPQPAARHAAAGHPALRPDRHDARLPRRAGQQDADRVDPVRHRPLRSPQHDHGRARRRRAGRLRRQAAGGPGLPGPRPRCRPATCRRST